MALHATTIRFADRAYMAIARAADSQGISVSQYVREAALIRAVLDELDSAEEAVHTAHDLLAIAREVRRLAEVDPPGPPRADPAFDASRQRIPAGPLYLALPHFSADARPPRFKHPSLTTQRLTMSVMAAGSAACEAGAGPRHRAP
jgi:hypothetical protein